MAATVEEKARLAPEPVDDLIEMDSREPFLGDGTPFSEDEA